MNYSIIIPIFKEKKNLLKLMYRLNKNLKSMKLKYEVIFIDDNSQDGSFELFKKNKKKNMKFYIRKENPKDLSKSVLYGFKKARFNNLVVMDGDLQHKPNDLIKLIHHFKNNKNDLVIGVRNLTNLKNSKLSFPRFFASKILILITNFLFNIKLKDPMSGFFIVKKRIIQKSYKFLFLKGYKILLDIILSFPKKLKIDEIEIDFDHRKKGHSKMNSKILYQLLLFIFIKKLKIIF